MAEMSPLGSLILKAMRFGCLLSAGFVVLVLSLEFGKRLYAGTMDQLTRQDWVFFTILFIILGAAAYFYRAISRELRQPGA